MDWHLTNLRLSQLFEIQKPVVLPWWCSASLTKNCSEHLKVKIEMSEKISTRKYVTKIVPASIPGRWDWKLTICEPYGIRKMFSWLFREKLSIFATHNLDPAVDLHRCFGTEELYTSPYGGNMIDEFEFDGFLRSGSSGLHFVANSTKLNFNWFQRNFRVQQTLSAENTWLHKPTKRYWFSTFLANTSSSIFSSGWTSRKTRCLVLWHYLHARNWKKLLSVIF